MSADTKIAVGRWTKTIEVNSEGDTITVNIGDYALMADLVSLVRELEDAAREVAHKASEIDADGVDKIKSIAECNAEVCAGLKDRVDAVLGAGTCLKVFGDVLPGIPELLDFLGQLVDVLGGFWDEAQKESDKRLSKYLSRYKKGD